MRFDSCANSYDAYAAPQRAFAECMARFIESEPGDQVIELGAGTGALTRNLCEKMAAVTATDASPAMVVLGRAAVPGANWSVLDAFESTLPQANLQVSSGLLQWAKDPEQILRRWRAALNKGGRMVHAFPCEPCLAEWRSLVPSSPVTWRDESAWRALFERSGLQVRRKALWTRQLEFPSALEMLQALHRSGVTGAVHLGAGRLRKAMRDYDGLHRGPKGVIATWAWLAIEATVA